MPYRKPEKVMIFHKYFHQFEYNFSVLMQWPCLSAIRSTIVDNETTNINETSISADTDGPHDAASRKIIHIALSTEYNY